MKVNNSRPLKYKMYSEKFNDAKISRYMISCFSCMCTCTYILIFILFLCSFISFYADSLSGGEGSNS